MSSTTTVTPVNQNQINQNGPLSALMQEQYTGEVEHSVRAMAKMRQFFPRKLLRGTNTLVKKAIGRTKLQKLSRGTSPDGTQVDLSKGAKVTVDTVVLSRHVLDEIESFVTDIDVRSEIAVEQGEDIAKFEDRAILIQAAKAAERSNSTFYDPVTGRDPEGHFGPTRINFLAANDELDPAMLYARIGDLFTLLEEKDVDPVASGMVLVMRPTYYNLLMQTEQLANKDYLTSDGNTLVGIPHIKAYNVPVISTTNLPNGVIADHFLSHAGNSNGYDGDFSDLVVLAVSPKALLIGEVVTLTSKAWFDDNVKAWKMDSWMSFGVGHNRVEYVGRIDKA